MLFSEGRKKMMKLILVLFVLGATVFENVAEAQRRGQGPTRGDRARCATGCGSVTRPPPVVHPPVIHVYPRHRATPIHLIADAADGFIIGCEVRYRVSGWANQLYVNGIFSGNFEDGIQNVALAQAIDDYLAMGRCHYQSSEQIALRKSLARNPYLIDDFVRGRSRNCYVLLGVSGWANQVFINADSLGITIKSLKSRGYVETWPTML
jgi:hypothetical protein